MESGGGGEKTEKATPKKRKDARERGQVRKSMEIVTALSMLATFGGLALLGGYMVDRIIKILYNALSGQLFFPATDGGTGLTAETFPSLLLNLMWEFFLTVLPILFVALVVGVVGNVLQFGFLFSTKALAPKFDKINPLKGLKRMFSMRSLFELAKSLAKVIVIGYIAYTKYSEFINEFALMTAPGIWVTAKEIGSLVLDTAFTVGIAYFILAVIDFVYQWFKYEKDLRMSKYEVKMEYKQQEGDPQIKSKIKQKQRQMAMMRMMQDVPDADVVITNPTHYAVALKYDDKISPAPIVIAKGKDLIAQRIKDVAREHKVEIVENKEVARSLYAMCEIGTEIPMDLYQTVAEILAFVFRKKNPR
ncbi:flagellar biosynthesis protein FlhB [Christensenellaceae bacterium OttesenSCG-928-M15]|nr:flagellar biosynthesis protein FlhB [Christensenellaceae bacterium OttesenSCG-928-M15]